MLQRRPVGRSAAARRLSCRYVALRGVQGIGLRLEDALAFWRQEFTQTVTACAARRDRSEGHAALRPSLSGGGGGVRRDDFDKRYAYNIRHNYGKEGKRTNYTPYRCAAGAVVARGRPG